MAILLCLLLLSSELQSACSPRRGQPCLSHPLTPTAFGKGFVLCELDPVTLLAGDSPPSAPTCPLHCSTPSPAGPAREPPGPAPQLRPLCPSLSPPSLAFLPRPNQNSLLPSPRASKSAEMGINTH